MDHDELKDRILLLSDPELGDAERLELKGHLAACAECRSAARRWSALSRGLAAAAAPASAEETERFVARVLARLPSGRAEEPAWSPLSWRLPAFGLAFAAAFFVAMTRSPETVSTRSLLLADGAEGAPLQSLLQSDSGATAAGPEETLSLGFEEP